MNVHLWIVYLFLSATLLAACGREAGATGPSTPTEPDLTGPSDPTGGETPSTADAAKQVDDLTGILEGMAQNSGVSGAQADALGQAIQRLRTVVAGFQPSVNNLGGLLANLQALEKEADDVARQLQTAGLPEAAAAVQLLGSGTNKIMLLEKTPGFGILFNSRGDDPKAALKYEKAGYKPRGVQFLTFREGPGNASSGKRKLLCRKPKRVTYAKKKETGIEYTLTAGASTCASGSYPLGYVHPATTSRIAPLWHLENPKLQTQLVTNEEEKKRRVGKAGQKLKSPTPVGSGPEYRDFLPEQAH